MRFIILISAVTIAQAIHPGYLFVDALALCFVGIIAALADIHDFKHKK